jgi:5-methylcytosine-specific restriction protein A
MSRNRTRPDAGWCDTRSLPRGPNGRALCRQCGQEVPRGQRSFCGPACIHEWKLRSSPGYLRAQVWKRDKGVCAICGFDTHALRLEFASLHWAARRDRMKQLGIPRNREYSLWDADHIVPVIEGGGECGIDNIRTLCIPCHKTVTAELNRRRFTKPDDRPLLDAIGGPS